MAYCATWLAANGLALPLGDLSQVSAALRREAGVHLAREGRGSRAGTVGDGKTWRWVAGDEDAYRFNSSWSAALSPGKPTITSQPIAAWGIADRVKIRAR